MPFLLPISEVEEICDTRYFKEFASEDAGMLKVLKTGAGAASYESCDTPAMIRAGGLKAMKKQQFSAVCRARGLFPRARGEFTGQDEGFVLKYLA